MTERTNSPDRKEERISCSMYTCIASACTRIGRKQDRRAPTQNRRPRPGRRRGGDLTTSSASWTQCWMVVLLTLLTLCSQVEASRRGSGQRSTYGRFLQSEEIHIDRSSPPRPDLLRRQEGGDLFQTKSSKEAASTTAPTTMSTTITRPDLSSPATAVASSASGIRSIVAPTGDRTSSASPAATSILNAGSGDTPTAQAFDGGLGSNYTEPSCPLFLNSFLAQDTFTDCMPFSLLLQTSMSFFAASKSSASISHTLDAACNVVYPTCSALMSSLAQQLRLDSNCGADYKLQNPMVRQAYAGLVAYDPLYQASCLKDSAKKYCFANAITNTKSPADSYVYYLPLGMPLPGGSQLTCNECLKTTMGYYNAVAGNKSQPVSTDYTQAAQIINMGCGPGFVNQTVSHLSQEGGAASRVPSMLGFSSAVLGGLVVLLQML